MKTTYTVKNFRIFDENGATLDFAPITVLTGRNSSGKSTVVKSIALLDTFFEQVRVEKDICSKKMADLKLDFSKLASYNLGSFDSLCGKKVLTFEYEMPCLELFDNVIVSLSFKAKENDIFNDGYLSQFVIKRRDGSVLYSVGEDGTVFDHQYFLGCFLDYEPLLYLIDRRNYLWDLEDQDLSICKNQKDEIKRLGDLIKSYPKDRCDVISVYVRNMRNNNPGYNGLKNPKYKDNEEIFQWTRDNGSLFYIPLVEHLRTLSKEDVCSLLKEMATNVGSPQQTLTNCICEDFMNSDSESFKDYMLTKESEFFANTSQCECVSNICSPGKFASKNRKYNSKTIQANYDNFGYIYDILMYYNDQFTKHSNSKYYHYFHTSFTFTNIDRVSHVICSLYLKFVNEILANMLWGDWVQDLLYTSTSNLVVKRIYPIESNDAFTEVLKNYILVGNMYSRKSDFVDKWLQKLEVGHHLSIKKDEFGVSYFVLVHKTENDKGILLADEGVGITQLVYILLTVQSILTLPKYLNKQVTIAVEEPEIHLHPQFQSLLADMFVDAYKKGVHFIIETHSEYLIRKLQYLVAQGTKEEQGAISTKDGLKKDDVIIQYFNHPYPERRGNEPQVKTIKMRDDGSLTEPFGPGFFDVANKLSMGMFNLKMQ
ncbi:MAG: AAA family ATPase [Bacteroidales bacterium]|nr:AAA family ATPase [Bacteroidales bacterium]